MALELTDGVVLSGRFRLERCIGAGGMGFVWAATNTATLRRVALKFLKADSASDPRVRRRFLREARAASAVRHPNVVEILDVLELDDGSPAIVMELLEGEPLSQRLRRQGKLDVHETASIMLHAISGVGAAHAAGIVHRDLKPDNIFLGRGFEDALVVKVLDFGIAKVRALDHEAGGQTEGLTGTGAMLGTPHYMSPEQVFADAVVDYRSDIWALGIIIYQCLAGVRPTQAENVGQIMKIIMTGAIVPLEKLRPDVPPELTDLVGRMLSFAREARPQSLKQVCEILRAHSDQTFATFGDPVYVNVVPVADSSSGEINKSSVPAASEMPTDEAVATRSERLMQVAGSVPPTRLDEPSGPHETRSSDADGSLHTENSLGLSLSSNRSATRRRWSKYAVAGLALTAVSVGVVTGRTLLAPAPGAPSATSSVPSLNVAANEMPSIDPVTATPDAGTSVVATDVDAATISAQSPVAPSAKPRSADKPAPRREPQRPNPSTSAPSQSVPTAAPGGLVEKLPF